MAITRSRDKLRSLQLLSRKGIGLPVTGFAHKPDDIKDLLDMVGGAPAVINLRLPKPNSHTELSMPVHVIHGWLDGPRLFVSAAIHGDEVNGVEVIRRLLELKSINRLRGTLVTLGARVNKAQVIGQVSDPYSGVFGWASI